jgi:hypothetical protein
MRICLHDEGGRYLINEWIVSKLLYGAEILIDADVIWQAQLAMNSALVVLGKPCSTLHREPGRRYLCAWQNAKWKGCAYENMLLRILVYRGRGTACEHRARSAEQTKILFGFELEISLFQGQAMLIALASCRHTQDMKLQLLCIGCMPVSSSRKQDTAGGIPSNAVCDSLS